MAKKRFQFSTSAVDFYSGEKFSSLQKIVSKSNAVILTDENVFNAHERKFKGWNCIVLKPGEAYKVQATADAIIDQLIAFGADRQTTLIGIGGGVVTDITGYVAAIYMRGIKCGFVPTTLLCMVDASIGGKNGIDVGIYKNMAGTIRQPSFIFQTTEFLATLPETEWQNGFAEIIKHACIKDARMFRMLEENDLTSFQKKKALLNELVQRNILLKSKVVQADEFEKGERKLLNFGHTIGHALENQYELSHGQAISIGMTYAALLSEQFTAFKSASKVIHLLEKYGLPTFAEFNKDRVMTALKMDKKKTKDSIHFVLLQKIGQGVLHEISLKQLNEFL